jgi:dihydrofolate reductase
MSKLSIIVAASSNNVIGRGNDLPWHLPTDMKYFKEKTLGKTVIMGRKCWDSIPEKFRPLPNRENIIVSGNFEFKAKDSLVVHDYEMLLSATKFNNSDDEVFIIGGAEIYNIGFNYADKVYLTRIEADVEGDVFLRGFDENQWELTGISDEIEENGFKFRFLEYERKNMKIKL